jgi:hypothetical protein
MIFNHSIGDLKRALEKKGVPKELTREKFKEFLCVFGRDRLRYEHETHGQSSFFLTPEEEEQVEQEVESLFASEGSCASTT